MLPPLLPAARNSAPVTLPALLLLACSVVPPASYPAFAEHAVQAEFVVPATGMLRLPATTADLVVFELGATPAPERELFGADGERWYVYAAGTRVQVQCRLRSYATGGDRPPEPAQLLPGAARIAVLDGP
ncbi:MAG: hypothetical protein KF830_07495 [Planctomycetes bacterium]|nr:hypothetical protein [Planctomycetota bacterium]